MNEITFPSLLTVCIITYNHEKFIRQAIEGVLSQKVNFTYRIVIADDCSTDGTQDILIEYKEKYPNLFTLILHEKNVGPAKNWFNLLSASNSKYTAYLEGDDYWSNEEKLQKQVIFLEENSDCVLCAHAFDLLDNQSGHIQKREHNFSKGKYNTLELSKENFIGSLTIMFRTEALPPWTINLGIGDYPVHLWRSLNGKFGYLEESMAVYRVHQNGISNRGDNLFRAKRFNDTFNVLFENAVFEEQVKENINIQRVNHILPSFYDMVALKDVEGVKNAVQVYEEILDSVGKIPEDALENTFYAIFTAYSLLLESGEVEMANKLILTLSQNLPSFILKELIRLNLLNKCYKDSTSYRLGKFITKPFVLFK